MPATTKKQRARANKAAKKAARNNITNDATDSVNNNNINNVASASSSSPSSPPKNEAGGSRPPRVRVVTPAAVVSERSNEEEMASRSPLASDDLSFDKMDEERSFLVTESGIIFQKIPGQGTTEAGHTQDRVFYATETGLVMEVSAVSSDWQLPTVATKRVEDRSTTEGAHLVNTVDEMEPKSLYDSDRVERFAILDGPPTSVASFVSRPGDQKEDTFAISPDKVMSESLTETSDENANHCDDGPDGFEMNEGDERVVTGTSEQQVEITFVESGPSDATIKSMQGDLPKNMSKTSDVETEQAREIERLNKVIQAQQVKIISLEANAKEATKVKMEQLKQARAAVIEETCQHMDRLVDQFAASVEQCKNKLRQLILTDLLFEEFDAEIPCRTIPTLEQKDSTETLAHENSVESSRNEEEPAKSGSVASENSFINENIGYDNLQGSVQPGPKAASLVINHSTYEIHQDFGITTGVAFASATESDDSPRVNATPVQAQRDELLSGTELETPVEGLETGSSMKEMLVDDATTKNGVESGSIHTNPSIKVDAQPFDAGIRTDTKLGSTSSATGDHSDMSHVDVGLPNDDVHDSHQDVDSEVAKTINDIEPGHNQNELGNSNNDDVMQVKKEESKITSATTQPPTNPLLGKNIAWSDIILSLNDLVSRGIVKTDKEFKVKEFAQNIDNSIVVNQVNIGSSSRNHKTEQANSSMQSMPLNSDITASDTNTKQSKRKKNRKDIIAPKVANPPAYSLSGYAEGATAYEVEAGLKTVVFKEGHEIEDGHRSTEAKGKAKAEGTQGTEVLENTLNNEISDPVNESSTTTTTTINVVTTKARDDNRYSLEYFNNMSDKKALQQIIMAEVEDGMKANFRKSAGEIEYWGMTEFNVGSGSRDNEKNGEDDQDRDQSHVENGLADEREGGEGVDQQDGVGVVHGSGGSLESCGSRGSVDSEAKKKKKKKVGGGVGSDVDGGEEEDKVNEVLESGKGDYVGEVSGDGAVTTVVEVVGGVAEGASASDSAEKKKKKKKEKSKAKKAVDGDGVGIENYKW
ncbi:hypothetical protein HDU76_013531 [Blyttiomyces sp. JEL0837]|nr:hypothetical protein HDU76_013531 [Blyttiomyces sp. JEL0837]